MGGGESNARGLNKYISFDIGTWKIDWGLTLLYPTVKHDVQNI